MPNTEPAGIANLTAVQDDHSMRYSLNPPLSGRRSVVLVRCVDDDGREFTDAVGDGPLVEPDPGGPRHHGILEHFDGHPDWSTALADLGYRLHIRGGEAG